MKKVYAHLVKLAAEIERVWLFRQQIRHHLQNIWATYFRKVINFDVCKPKFQKLLSYELKVFTCSTTDEKNF